MQWFKDRNGRWWSPNERMASYRKTKQAIESGAIPPATVCARCGVDQHVAYHNHDYSHPTDHLEALCWRCHFMVHVEYRAPEQARDYWRSLEAGRKWPVISRMEFGRFAAEHNIPRGGGRSQRPTGQGT